MALLFIDGFEYGGAFLSDYADVWDVVGGTASAPAVPGRRPGTYGVWLPQSGFAANVASLKKKLPSHPATIVVGFAFQVDGTGGGLAMLHFVDGTSTQIALAWQNDGTVQFLRNGLFGTVVATSAATPLSASSGLNVWHWIEVKITFSTTVGTIDFKVDGTSYLSITGANTSASGHAYCDGVVIGSARASTSSDKFLYDDLYICDTTGTEYNDFLGDVRVDRVYLAGDGTHQDFTPSSGTRHFALVNENVDNTADYVQATAVGAEETYTLDGTNLNAVTGSILGVQVTSKAEDPTGNRSLQSACRSGSSEGVGTSRVLPTIYTPEHDFFSKDPATSAAWTLAAIKTAEFGVKVSA